MSSELAPKNSWFFNANLFEIGGRVIIDVRPKKTEQDYYREELGLGRFLNVKNTGRFARRHRSSNNVGQNRFKNQFPVFRKGPISD